MFDKLEELLQKYNDLTEKISNPEIIADQNIWRKYTELNESKNYVQEQYKKAEQ